MIPLLPHILPSSSPPFIFQTTAVVGVALSCFKVKVPFIVAIKQEQPWENERARMPGESAGGGGGGGGGRREEIRRDKGRKRS